MASGFRGRFRRRDPDEEWRRPHEPGASPVPPPGPPGQPPPPIREDRASTPPREAHAEFLPEGRGAAAPSPSRDEPSRPDPPSPVEPIISAHALVRTYPGRSGVTAVKGVSIAVRPGDFVALMGPSGSGKTTLLGLLAGLDRPEEGRVSWRGLPMDEFTPADLQELRRKRIGVVFQSFGLLPTLSALENVELPLRIAGRPLDDVRDAAAGWLERLGLGDRLENRTFELSAGQQQRVAVARALVVEPDVVLADEPIAEVDSENADLILDALAGVARRGGAVLAATHNPAALAYAGSVILLRDGRIEASGPPEEMAARLSTD
jgi:putative ABC transport system ATP-binding protein